MKLDSSKRVGGAMKMEVLELVARTRDRSRWKLDEVLVALGVTRSVYFAWQRRRLAGRLEDAQVKAPCLDVLLPEEVEAIKRFSLLHPLVGYRKLSWMMVDAGIAYASESAVYRVLHEAGLLSRWKKRSTSSGEYKFKPQGPNEQWHTDVMYVWVNHRYYFLLSFIDAYSRYIVHHKLMIQLNGVSVATELEEALAQCGAAKPRIVHDHGGEFVNRDMRAVVKAHNLLDIKTKARHPESNGIIERFNGTVRDETGDAYGRNYLEAERIIGRLVTHYNHERLHAALGYMQPIEWYRGNPEERRQVRTERLQLARRLRREKNRQLNAAAA